MTTPSILSFPTEIIRAICAELLHMAKAMPTPAQAGFAFMENAQAASLGLSNLAKTCSLLRKLAQPYSYRDFEFPEAAFKKLPATDNYELNPWLLRCYRQTDLAAAIRHISAEISQEDEPLGKGFEEVWLELEACGFTLPSERPQTEYSAEMLLFGLLLNRASRAESLEIRLGYLENAIDIPVEFSLSSIKSINVSHLDTEGGFSLEDIEKLLQKATGIQSLQMHMCLSSVLSSSTTLPTLKTLDISYSHLTVENVEGLVSLCPMLESFTYEGAGGVVSQYGDGLEFNGDEAQTALLPLSKTLKRLELEMDDYHSEDLTEDDQMTDLKAFEVLETLKVTTDYIYFEESEQESCLVDLLPSSIKHLQFSSKLESYMLNSILELAKKTGEGVFPNLKIFEFYETKENTDMAEVIRRAFEVVGVSATGLKYSWPYGYQS
jgi:hypothetical protein